MEAPRIAMISLWRNDERRRLKDRVDHLLSKTHPNLRWLWMVGDSSDDTFAAIGEALKGHPAKNVEVFVADSGIVGDDHETRLRRLSLAVNATLDRVRPDDEYVLWHESDLVSPPDVAERLLKSGKCPVAGWPVIHLPQGILFYDTYLYSKNGMKFSNYPPYHECVRLDAPFEVDSAGSVLLFRAEDARAGVRCWADALLEICANLRKIGRTIWVDPYVTIVQPTDLWTPTTPGQ